MEVLICAACFSVGLFMGVFIMALCVAAKCGDCYSKENNHADDQID